MVWGSLLGAFILTTLPEVLRFMADYRDIIYGALLVLLMAVRPDGLLTEDVIERIRTKLFGPRKKYEPPADREVMTERFRNYAKDTKSTKE